MKRQAYGIALAELHEVAAAVELGQRAGWVSADDCDQIWSRAEGIGRMLGRLQQ